MLKLLRRQSRILEMQQWRLDSQWVREDLQDQVSHHQRARRRSKRRRNDSIIVYDYENSILSNMKLILELILHLLQVLMLYSSRITNSRSILSSCLCHQWTFEKRNFYSTLHCFLFLLSDIFSKSSHNFLLLFSAKAYRQIPT